MLKVLMAGMSLAVGLSTTTPAVPSEPAVVMDSKQVKTISDLVKDGAGVATPLTSRGSIPIRDIKAVQSARISAIGVSFKKKEVLTHAEKLEIKRKKEERERRCRIEAAKKKAWGREKAYCDAYEENVLDGVANCNSDCISYMRYTSVTDTSSPQWRLLRGSSYTDSKTGIRMVGDRYCIALGSGYASKIGTKVDLVMMNGSIIKCILGDQKSDRGTDKATHTFHQFYDGTSKPGDGSVAEMIVDGSSFTGVECYPESFEGRIRKVVVFPDGFFD